MTNLCWHILLVDDDDALTGSLARALSRRGYCVSVATDRDSALARVAEAPPDAAVLDLKLAEATGLSLITPLKAANPAMRILLLTGYASIATAVEAIKLGATHYLPKPADSDEILAALGREAGSTQAAPPPTPMSVNRLQWEHIQKVLVEHDGNISATARALKMHRRTLQRKLLKKPTKE